jgi:ribonuclease T1
MNLKWMNVFCAARILPALALVSAVSFALAATPAIARSHHSSGGYSIEDVALSALPVEAKETLRQIRQGGPFSYPRDGVVFGNFEKRLLAKQRGYYHEFTVRTPGVRSRGARRIVCGLPPECYYSDDHYETFKRIRE